MIKILFFILIGVFIGWNTKQPAFMKAIQQTITQWWHNRKS